MIPDLEKRVQRLESEIVRIRGLLDNLFQQLQVVRALAAETQPYFPPQALGTANERGLGQVNNPGGIAAGATGRVDDYKWSGAVWTNEGTYNTMRNTSGVTIAHNAKVSWMYDDDSAQYVCVPLEC